MNAEKFLDEIGQLHFGQQEKRLITNALNIAENSHNGFQRLEGIPYIEHVISVARILISWNSPPHLIAAGLLHDVMNSNYSSPPTYENIKNMCGQDVELLVRGSTEISKFGTTFPRDEALIRLDSVENIAGVFPEITKSFGRTPLVFIIRIANHLDNAKSVHFTRSEDQEVYARLALNILVPLAARFGMDFAKRELEDIGFQILEPVAYEKICERYPQEAIVKASNSIINKIREEMLTNNLQGEVNLAPKSCYSLYRYWLERGGTDSSFFSAETAYPYLITVNTSMECYQALGILHRLFTPVHTQFMDYIATPKINGYRSLHTKLRVQPGTEIQVIIRDDEMNNFAEKGITTKWSSAATDVSQMIKQLDNLDTDQILLFTPTGEIKYLPHNSTPVDFAFAIHREVGIQCASAIVNGRQHDLKDPLIPFSSVKIVTNRNSVGPQTTWLNFVKSKLAISEIQKYYMVDVSDPLIDKGRQILSDALAAKNVDLSFQDLSDRLDVVCKEKRTTLKQILIDIAQDKIGIHEVIRLIVHEDLARVVNEKFRETFTVINIIAHNRTGLAADITAAARSLNIGLETIQGYPINSTTARMKISLGDIPLAEVEQLIEKLHTIDGVQEIYPFKRQVAPSRESSPYPLEIAWGTLFKGRQKELRSLLEKLLLPGKAVLLWGPRRIGKTSLLNAFHEYLDPKKFVVQTLDIRNSMSTLDLLHTIMEQLHNDSPEVNIPKWSTIKKNPLYSFDSFIQRVLPQNASLIIAIDEFQVFNSLGEKRESAYLSKIDLALYLRHQIQNEKKISLILCGGGFLKDLNSSESLSSLLELCSFMELEFLARDDAKKIIIETNVIYEEAAVSTILNLTSNHQKTANHPGLIQIVCRDLSEKYGESITDEIVGEWLDIHLFNVAEQYFNNLWGSSFGMDASQQIECLAVLVSIAQSMESMPWVPEHVILNSELEKIMSPTHIQRALHRLRELRTIVQNPAYEKEYSISTLLAAIWLRKRFSIPELCIDYPEILGR